MTPLYLYHWLRRWDARPSRLRAAWYALKLWWIAWRYRAADYPVTASGNQEQP